MKELNKVIKILKKKLKDKVLTNIALSTLTSFKIGGNAKCVVEITNLEDAFYSLKILERNNVNYFILGNGTNILASDFGFNGIILKFSDKFSDVEIRDDVICAYSGASLNKVCASAKMMGLSGLENLFGIPGTIGGAVFMNAGAFGTEIADLVTCAYVYVNGKVRMFNHDELEFSYRHSKLMEFNNPVILMVELKLTKGDKNLIEEKMTSAIKKKKSTQPLDFPSAGSIFKKMDGIIVSQMLDKEGLKGYNIFDACVSEKHAGFIVNKSNASAKDVYFLINYIKDLIFKKYNIKLIEEIVYLGEFDDFTR